MFELLKNILIAIGALVVCWLIAAIIMGIRDSNNESYSQSVTDDSLVKKYEALLKKFKCMGVVTSSNFIPAGVKCMMGAPQFYKNDDAYLWMNKTETCHDYLSEVEEKGIKKGYRFVLCNGKWCLQGMIITKDGDDIKVEYCLAKMPLPHALQEYGDKFQLSNFVLDNAEEYWKGNDLRNAKEEEKKRQEEKDKKLLDAVNKSIDDYMKTEDPKLKELRISSYFDCKGMVQTIQDLNAIKDPQDGDKYLFLLKGDTVDNYLDNHKTWVIRIVYIRGDWYINHLHVNTEDHGDGTISISFYSIEGVTEKIDMVSIHVNNMTLDEYVAFQYLNQNSIINAHILSGGEFDSMFHSIRRVLK